MAYSTYQNFFGEVLAGRVANCLGLEPDIELLQNCHDLWVTKGYNPQNLVWVFEWYPSRMYYTNPNDQAVLEYSPEYDFEEVVHG